MKAHFAYLLSALVIGVSVGPAWTQDLPAVPQPPQPVQSQPPASTDRPATAAASLLPSWGDPQGATQGTWSGGAGAYFFQLLGSNPAYNTSTGSGFAFLANSSTTKTQTNFATHVDAAPIVFLGYTNADGWGLRGQWFEFTQNSSANTTLDGLTSVTTPGGTSVGSNVGTPTAGSVVTAQSSLSFSVLDLEATRSFVYGNSSLLVFAGIRYAHISQSYELSVADPTNGTSLYNANHNFNGVGATFGLDAHRQILETPFSLYGKARLSLLVGSSDQINYSLQQSFGGFTNASTTQTNQTSLLGMTEIEAGAEWSQSWGRFRLFAQAGFATQFWFDVNSPGANTEGSTQGYFANTFTFIGGVARLGLSF